MGGSCKVVTFICDRPGVGRSMAVASAALLLASNGWKVLVIDWDLPKPSLAKYFVPFLPPHALDANDGLIDVLWAYASAARRAKGSGLSDVQKAFATLSPVQCDIPSELRTKDGGEMHFLSAGRERLRNTRVRYFSWGELFDRLDGHGLLGMLWAALRDRYELILIDCHEIGQGLGTFPALQADILVSCFTLDVESLQTVSAFSQWAADRVKTRRLAVCPLTMRVQDAEYALLMQMRQYRDGLFETLKDRMIVPGDGPTLELMEVAYYAHQRVLPPLVRHGGRVIDEYRRLAGTISGQSNIAWSGPDEEQSSRYVSLCRDGSGRFSPASLPWLPPYSGNETYAFVSYARDDRDYVVPILQELLNVDARLWWDDDIPGGQEWRMYLHNRIAKAEFVLVFLSDRAARSQWVAEEIRVAEQHHKPLLSVRLDKNEMSAESRAILSRFQMLDWAADDFREQLGRGVTLLMQRSD